LQIKFSRASRQESVKFTPSLYEGLQLSSRAVEIQKKLMQE